MRQEKGFSLIELLIVVAIILIIAALAVPSFLRSRLQANESAAVATLRTLNTAQISYNSAYPSAGYASQLSYLSGTNCAPPNSQSACLIDNVLASGTRSGYLFVLSNASGTPAATYQVIASPVASGVTGGRFYCTFQDAIVRYSTASIGTCDASVSPQQ